MKNDMNDWGNGSKPTVWGIAWWILLILSIVAGLIALDGLYPTDGEADMRYRNNVVQPRAVEAWPWE